MGENQRITHQPPKDGHQAGNAKTLRQDGKNVFRADKTAVKKRESGQCHKKH
jgi:hypothetical protein